MANQIEKGLATFEQRSDTEARALPIIRAYIDSLEATVNLEPASLEVQRADDIDFFWTRSYKARLSTISIEVKVDTQIHETGNFAFETISNETRFTQGCFMRSKADYFYYYASESEAGDLWIFPLIIVRQWFEREMSSRPNRFRDFKTHTLLPNGNVYIARGYLVPIGELSRFLGNELRHRQIGTSLPGAEIVKMITEVFPSTEVSNVLCVECGQPCDNSHPFSHDAVPPTETPF
jgi:hypothetical protein